MINLHTKLEVYFHPLRRYLFNANLETPRKVTGNVVIR